MFSYVGGKYHLSDWIISNFPEDYQKMCYVEVFGGAGWVLFKKERSIVEVYNDINGDLVNVFKQIRDNPKKLLYKLSWTFHSRQMHKEAVEKRLNNNYNDDVERAVGTILISTISNFGVSEKPTYGYSRKKNIASNITAVYKRIKKHYERYRYVNIENEDYKSLIKRYDSENTLFYLDPPYYGSEKYYGNDFTREDHKILADILKNIKGKFLLSYYDCEFANENYKDCYILKKSAVKNGTIQSKSNNCISRENRERVTELLIANYEINKQPQKRNGQCKTKVYTLL